MVIKRVLMILLCISVTGCASIGNLVGSIAGATAQTVTSVVGGTTKTIGNVIGATANVTKGAAKAAADNIFWFL